MLKSAEGQRRGLSYNLTQRFREAHKRSIEPNAIIGKVGSHVHLLPGIWHHLCRPHIQNKTSLKSPLFIKKNLFTRIIEIKDYLHTLGSSSIASNSISWRSGMLKIKITIWVFFSHNHTHVLSWGIYYKVGSMTWPANLPKYSEITYFFLYFWNGML